MAAKATRELNELFTTALEHGLKNEEIRKTVPSKSLKPKHEYAPTSYTKCLAVLGLVAVLLALRVPREAKGDYLNYYKIKLQDYFSIDGVCLVSNSDLTLEMVRPSINCKICHNFTEVCWLIIFYLLFNARFYKCQGYLPFFKEKRQKLHDL